MKPARGKPSARIQELNDSLEQLHFALRRITETPNAILARRGLRRAHQRILFFVARRQGLSVNDLLRELRVTKQALHAPLNQLKARKLVQVRPSPGDRRRKELFLTPAGTELEAQLTGPQRERLEQALRRVGPSSGRIWRQVLREIAGPPEPTLGGFEDP
ncbi:MAG TPA: MarR family winged helix-turn-helix transcriptional regulator [bacterium]|nr:MarR family winged helix-turn-helix transcriptional regulator [bacterium]